ncbi:protein FAM98B-like [Dysidea avara]|uniref:protein FAM98B-like n=1 Tax=Dysidea avara TaxID=196820 RepID=UPI00331E5B60
MSDFQTALANDVLDSLAALGYEGELSDTAALSKAVQEGLASRHYCQIIVQLCSELKETNKMEESVSPPQGVEDQDTFNLEMKGFLQELQCPYSSLTSNIGALNKDDNRMLLLSYLLSELQVSRLLKEEDKQAVVKPKGSPVEEQLRAILNCYGITTPPPADTPPRKVLEKVIGKTKQALSEATPDHISKPLVSKPLTVEQWANLDRINDSLTREYANRRTMLIMRVQLTGQSFGWSDKSKDNDLAKVLQEHQKLLKSEAPVSVARILAARSDLTVIQPASRGVVRQNTQSVLNKVLLQGRVPDRGGRPNETRPPLEMPSFKQRTEAPQQQRQGRGGGGGRVQGGWGGSGKKGGRGKGGGQWGGGGGQWGSGGGGGQWGSGGGGGGYFGGKSGGINWH